jgi:hypothetical protein
MASSSLAPREVQALIAGLAATIHATASSAKMGMSKHQDEKVTQA